MPKRPYVSEATRRARFERQQRFRMIKEGRVTSLFKDGSKTLDPEIRKLIEAAIEKKSQEDDGSGVA